MIRMFIGLLFLSGCSVYKAASNEGVSVADVRQCHQKECLLSKGMSLIDTSQSNSNGEVVSTFKAIARKSGLNYLRAAGHGALDVMTLGLWEVAGTPIEGAMSNNNGYIIAKATCADTKPNEIIKLEIYDNNGVKVQ